MNLSLSFKIPTWVYLLFLVLLVIFVLYKICSSSEGFINYNYGASPNSKIQIPNTDASGYLIFDNDYYYPETGKIIRVYGAGPGPDGSGNDGSANDIDYVIVYEGNKNGSQSGERVNATSSEVDGKTTYTLDKNINVASDDALPAMYNSWYTQAVPDDYKEYANNQIYYANNGYTTYIHVIDNNASSGDKNNYGLFQAEGTTTNKTFTAGMTVDYAPGGTWNGGEINGIVVGGETLIDCYQVGEFIYYNINNGDLYIDASSEGSNKLLIYQRSNGQEYTGSDYVFPNDRSLSSSDINFMAKDTNGGNLVVYIAHQYTTLLLILKKEQDGSSKGVYSLGDNNTFRFDTKGLVIGPPPDDGSDSDSDSDSDDYPPPPVDASGSDYWKWYWYWNSTNTPIGGYSNKYMLKTQMVPPVCPACPACPSSVSCNNCGGTGGSGTVDSSGNSIVGNVSNTANTAITTTGDLATKTIDTGESVFDKTLDSLGDLVSGADDLLRDATTGTVDLAKDTVSGTVDLAKDTVSGTVDLAKSAVGGTAKILTGRNGSSTNVSGTTTTTTTTNGQQAMNGTTGNYYTTSAMDPYTYNGQLPQRPESNYLPVTNSFAAFGK